VNVNTTDATTGATALLLPAQNTHTLHVRNHTGTLQYLGRARMSAVALCGLVLKFTQTHSHSQIWTLRRNYCLTLEKKTDALSLRSTFYLFSDKFQDYNHT
jgi:hypothetical protein